MDPTLAISGLVVAVTALAGAYALLVRQQHTEDRDLIKRLMTTLETEGATNAGALALIKNDHEMIREMSEDVQDIKLTLGVKEKTVKRAPSATTGRGRQG